ncbi:MAG TPA: ORF6N domain-containing protein [Puia sp.]|nr:ORF6N domain-containing protein [Puia sp.]
MTKKNEMSVPDEIVISKIYFIRETKVMLDIDLAVLYEVETKQLKRQVNRNIDRFPKDFMFKLNKKEFENLRGQNGTSSWGGIRYMPMAFTEQGVAMLSSVLNSKRAIRVNIQIIRIFNRMRKLLLNYHEILLKVEEVERQTLRNKDDIKAVFDYLKKLLVPREQVERRRIGFSRHNKE